MSRYVRVAVAARHASDVVQALAAIDLEPQVGRPEQLLMLEGSLECAGEPVELRFDAGVCNTVEDFGFVCDAQGRYQLVCGEFDRALLEKVLLVPLRRQLALLGTLDAAHQLGLAAEVTETEGVARIVLREA
ncbi:MAG: hypothetical protein ACPG77_17965 [Nannocystaceae bacterium]